LNSDWFGSQSNEGEVRPETFENYRSAFGDKRRKKFFVRNSPKGLNTNGKNSLRVHRGVWTRRGQAVDKPWTSRGQVVDK